METASSKKLALSTACSSHGEPSGDPSTPPRDAGYTVPAVSSGKGIRLIPLESLSRVLDEMCRCSVCGSPVILVEDVGLGSRKGLASSLSISCTNTKCKRKHRSRKIMDPNF